MAEAEVVAQQAPHEATVVILDTMKREFQESETYMRLTYDSKGFERPQSHRTNEEWYVRQGYEVMPGVGDGEVYQWTEVTTQERADVPIVYLKKDLVK